MGIKFPTLTADQIECRVSTISDKGCSLLLYKDARCDMNMLNEHVGALNWRREPHEVKGVLYCRVSIYDSDKEEWVSKSDCGVESNAEKQKGESSDSFKRACVNWGIGIELYTAPFIWINADKLKLEDRNGKKTTRDKFSVTHIAYDSKRQISELTIQNDKTGNQCYHWESGQKPAPPKQEKQSTPKKEQPKLEKEHPKLATPDQMDKIKVDAKEMGVDLNEVFKKLKDEGQIDGHKYKKNGETLLTMTDYAVVKAYLLGVLNESTDQAS